MTPGSILTCSRRPRLLITGLLLAVPLGASVAPAADLTSAA